jgi:DNA-binding CsgD family transcriptional regulator/ketosteroid isomerase-like protein
LSRRTAVLDSWFTAFNSHDIAGLEAVADPEIVLVPLGGALTIAPGTTFHGHEGMASLVVPGFERFPDMRVRPLRYIEHGDTVVVPMQFILDDGTGGAAVRTGATVFTIRDDRVLRLHAYATEAEALAVTENDPMRLLTPREREVLSLLAEGMSIKQVASHLVLSPFTVRTHVQNLRHKLGARSTGHAIVIAFRKDLPGA